MLPELRGRRVPISGWNGTTWGMIFPYLGQLRGMDETEWAKVLHYLYEEQESINFLSGETVPEFHDIVSETGLSSETVHSTLEDMEEIELVDLEYLPTGNLDISPDFITEVVSYKIMISMRINQ